MIKQFTIRLQRNKLYKKPQYKIVVLFKSNSTKAAPLDILGKFVPQEDQKMFFIDVDRLAFWLQKGASVSNTVIKLLGRLSGAWNKKSFKHTKKNISVMRLRAYKTQRKFLKAFIDKEVYTASRFKSYDIYIEEKMWYIFLKQHKYRKTNLLKQPSLNINYKT